MLYLQQNILWSKKHNSQGPVEQFIHRNCQTHNFHRVLHDQLGHLLTDRQYP